MTQVEVPGHAPGLSLYSGRATGTRNWNGNLGQTGFPHGAHSWCGPEVNSRQILGLAWVAIRAVYNPIRNCNIQLIT